MSAVPASLKGIKSINVVGRKPSRNSSIHSDVCEFLINEKYLYYASEDTYKKTLKIGDTSYDVLVTGDYVGSCVGSRVLSAHSYSTLEHFIPAYNLMVDNLASRSL